MFSRDEVHIQLQLQEYNFCIYDFFQVIDTNDILLNDILVLEVCHAVFILGREMGISAHNLRKVSLILRKMGIFHIY